MNDAELLLRRLGATANYLGFYYLLFAMDIIIRDASYLLMVNKGMYPEIARHFDTTTGNVERGMRTVISACWRRGNRKMFAELAGWELDQKPSTTEFIDMAASYLKTRQSKATASA